MKRYLIYFLLLFVLGITGITVASELNVPVDYNTIQEAIDASSDGDNVIVSPGIYYENINYNGKAIMVASLYYTTGDTSYISQTVIDGNQAESVVVFDNNEGINSVLSGFTITNGFSSCNGGGIFSGNNCSPTLTNLRIIDNHAEFKGGGFYCGENCNSVISNLLVTGNDAYDGGGGAYFYYCELIMEDSEISNNASSGSGGGIYTSETNIEFQDLVVTGNSSSYGGGFYFNGWSGSNILKDVFIYQNEVTGSGGGIVSNGELYLENVTIAENYAENSGGGMSCYGSNVTFAEEIHRRCSIYLNECNNNVGNDINSQSAIQEIYLEAFTVLVPSKYYIGCLTDQPYEIGYGIIPQVDADLYVSSNGNNENSGLCAEEPLQTISHAISRILPDIENPHTIHLGAGTYGSSTNGEKLPLYIPDGMNIKGENRDSVILDGEESSSVIMFDNVEGITVSGLTVTRGNGFSGGIFCSYSEITLEDMKIINNHSNSNGGGIYSFHSSLKLNNLIIADNYSNKGGGIYLDENTRSVLTGLTVYGNAVDWEGGGLYSTSSHPKIVNSIFWNNSPREIYCTGISETLTIAYSDIKSSPAIIFISSGMLYYLNGYIDEDPLISDGSNEDFQLLEGSPCIDGGTAYLEYEGEVLVDLQESEYSGIAPDMGACEYTMTEYDEFVIQNPSSKIQNYPNPFNPETTISFNLPDDCMVELGIYNLKGQLIDELISENMVAGKHNVIWKGKKERDRQTAGSGIYFVKLQTDNRTELHKILMVK